jgi:hypothetical protein
MRSNSFCRWLVLSACGFLVGAAHLLVVQSNSAVQHDQHMADMKEHGAAAMGFDQDKTAHHFFLRKDGGVITVRAKNPKDALSISQIQHHLALQAGKFSRGDFGAPEQTHSRVPPGVPAMQEMKDEIRYQFRKSRQGGKLRISSSNPTAIEAIHRFLKFQIQEHQTGDRTALH